MNVRRNRGQVRNTGRGIVVTIASLAGGRAYARMMDLTGAFGAVVLLFPQLYRRFAITVLYEDPDKVEWNPRFTNGRTDSRGTVRPFAVRAFTKRRASK